MIPIDPQAPGKRRRALAQLPQLVDLVVRRLPSLRSRGASSRITIALAFAACFLTSLGPILDEKLFLAPLTVAAHALGLAPRLDPAVRVIVVEDATLAKLGRFPTLGQWREVADRLEARGFQRIILSALNRTADETVDAEPGRHAPLAAGAVVYPGGTNPRVKSWSAYDQGTFAPPAPNRGLPQGEFLMGLEPSAMRSRDDLGAVNILTPLAQSFAYRMPDEKLLPNLGLLALGRLEVRDGKLWSGGRRLPEPVDGQIFVNWVSRESLREATLAAANLFERNGTVPASFAPHVEAKLQGGVVAILTSEAYTGARFLDTPIGSLPGYQSTVAIANCTLQGCLLFRPVRVEAIGVALAILLVLLADRGSTRAALTRLAGFAVVVVGGSTAAHFLLGWRLPAAECGVLLGAASLHRFLFDARQSQLEKQRLRADLELGRAVQQLLLPAETCGATGPWSWRIRLKPYGSMSGDWAQVFVAEHPAAGAPLAIVAIGDVVGKGPSAALITAAIACIWNSSAAKWSRGGFVVEAFLDELNTAILGTFRNLQFSTISLAVLYPDRIQTISCAGPAWLRIDRSEPGAVKSMGVVRGQNPIGTGGTRLFRVHDFRPEGSCLLLAYTDGVLDGAVPKRAFAAEIARRPLDFTDAAEERLEADLLAAGASTALPDDQTILIVRFEALPLRESLALAGA